MRPNLGEVIFYTIIAVHVAAAVIPIRNWPLTDYPMFSETSEKFTSLSKLTFLNVRGAEVTEWPRSDYSSVGFNSDRLQAWVKNPRHPEVKKFLRERVQYRKDLPNKPEAIIIRKTAYVLIDNKLVAQTEDIEKIPYAELEN